MLNLLKKCALLLLVLSLPLPSLHALAMPLCNPDAQRSDMHQHSHGGDAAEHNHDQQAPDINLTCDGCSMCQVCSAPAIASSALDFSLDVVAAPPSTPGNSLTLFVPEQPQRPPLAVPA